MDLRRLPAVVWVSFLAMVLVAGVVGLALGGLLFAREVRVEVPVEIVTTVDRVVEKPAVLDPEQEYWMKMMKPAREAFTAPSVGYLETAVMPFRNKVKVSVLMSDELNIFVPRSAVQSRVEAALREAGLEIVPADSKDAEFSTTAFVVFDLMFRDNKSLLVGEVRLNLNQTLLCYSDEVWRKCNVTTSSSGTTIYYGADNFAKIVDVAADLAPEAGQVLRKADEIGRARKPR
jgi:hypothetical protein